MHDLRLLMISVMGVLLITSPSLVLIGNGAESEEVDPMDAPVGHPIAEGSRSGDAAAAYEYRSMWMDGYEIVNISEIREVVDFARRYNFNCLSPLINGNYNGVFYNSSYQSKHIDVTWDFNPLLELIREAHKYGIHVHPWFHTLYNRNLVREHPEWATVTRSGYRSAYWLNPALPEVRSYVINLTMEIMRDYPVDGIKLDTIRYGGSSYSYDTYSIQKFLEEGGGDFSAWRRKQVTELEAMIYDAVMEVRPYKWVGADVWQYYTSWYNYVFQESREWAKMGKVDYLSIMSYTTSMSTINNNVQDYLDNSHGVPITSGPYVYIPGNTAHGSVPNETVGIELLVNQVESSREMGVMGVCLFAYKFLKLYPSYAQALFDGPFSWPAICPIKNMTLPATTTRWEFNREQDREGWRLQNAGHNYPTDGFWTLGSINRPALTSPLINRTCEGVNVIEISMKCDAVEGGVAVYWSDSFERWEEYKRVDFKVKTDREWHLYSIHLDKSEFWNGDIRYLRIIPSFQETTNITIDFIRLHWMPYCIQEWATLGSFTTGDPARLLEWDYIGNEMEVIPYQGGVEGGREWMPYHMERDQVDLRFVYGRLTYSVAYTHLYIKAPASQYMQMRIGSSDGVRVWLNGEETVNNILPRRVAPDQNVTNILLKKGINRLMVKLAVYENEFSYFLRFTTLDNRSVEGLEYYPFIPTIDPPEPVKDFNGWGREDRVDISWDPIMSTTEIVDYEWSLDDGTVKQRTEPRVELRELEEGEHHFRTRAVDEFGFRSEWGEIGFQLEWTIPMITEPKPTISIVSGRSIEWAWELTREPIYGIEGYYVTVRYSSGDSLYQDSPVKNKLAEETGFILDDDVYDGFLYDISVRVVSNTGLAYTANSTEAVMVDLRAPLSPRELTMEQSTENKLQYNLSWKPSQDNIPEGVKRYEVWNRVDGEEWTQLDEIGQTYIIVQRQLDHFSEFKVRGIDIAGQISEFSSPAAPQNMPPIPDISRLNNPYYGSPLVLSSEGSVDLDGEIREFRWMIDKETVALTETLTLTMDPGDYDVILRVKDDLGETASSSVFVRVKGTGNDTLGGWLLENAQEDVIHYPPEINDTGKNEIGNGTIEVKPEPEEENTFDLLPVLYGIAAAMAILILTALGILIYTEFSTTRRQEKDAAEDEGWEIDLGENKIPSKPPPRMSIPRSWPPQSVVNRGLNPASRYYSPGASAAVSPNAARAANRMPDPPPLRERGTQDRAGAGEKSGDPNIDVWDDLEVMG